MEINTGQQNRCNIYFQTLEDQNWTQYWHKKYPNIKKDLGDFASQVEMYIGSPVSCVLNTGYASRDEQIYSINILCSELQLSTYLLFKVYANNNGLYFQEGTIAPRCNDGKVPEKEKIINLEDRLLLFLKNDSVNHLIQALRTQCEKLSKGPS